MASAGALRVASEDAAINVCVASHFNSYAGVANGLCYEAATALAEMCGSSVLSPPAIRRRKRWKIASYARRKLSGKDISFAAPRYLADTVDLFVYVGMNLDSLTTLESIPNWRENAGCKVAFLYETWTSAIEEKSNLVRILDDFDHVFLFIENSIASIRKYTKTPCSYLSAGVDCLRANPFSNVQGDRPIDVYGMGRMDEEVHDQLVEMTSNNELLYVWDRIPSFSVQDFQAARFRTYHMIRHSRLFASFNFRTGQKKDEAQGEDAIPARVFEGAAAGAVMFGTAPKMAEFDELFDWPDAHVEIPFDPTDVRGAFAAVQKQAARYRRAGIRNAVNSLRRHDWAYRFEEILQALDMPVPDGLIERKRRLSRIADEGAALLS